jgi:hypothetical protein
MLKWDFPTFKMVMKCKISQGYFPLLVNDVQNISPIDIGVEEE